MEEIEVPTEHLHERINEAAEKEKEKWSLWVALSTALMAVFAAVSGLLAGHHANEALLDQVKSSDAWSHYQSKSIKSEIASATNVILQAQGKEKVSPDEEQKVQRYEKEKEALSAEAENDARSSEAHLVKHNILARAVTFFQIAIAIAAISIITKKRLLWIVAIVLMLGGIFFLVQGSLA